MNNRDYKTIFIGKHENKMYMLLNHLNKNNFDALIKVSLRGDDKTSSAMEPKYPMYYIGVHKDEHEEALNEGIAYASAKHFDEIICAYPNLDFDTIGNIRARENGITK